mgnify:FL=1
MRSWPTRMLAAVVLVPAQSRPEDGRSPVGRGMSQLVDHAVTDMAVTAAAMTPVIRLDRAAQQNGPLRGQVLTSRPQAEVIKASERGQISRGEGSVVHVEVFGGGRVRTSIIHGPRTLVRTRARPTDPHPHP